MQFLHQGEAVSVTFHPRPNPDGKFHREIEIARDGKPYRWIQAHSAMAAVRAMDNPAALQKLVVTALKAHPDNILVLELDGFGEPEIQSLYPIDWRP